MANWNIDTSHSNSHPSRNPPVPSSSNRKHPLGNDGVNTHLENRIHRMEEAQIEILRLLREPRPLAPTRQPAITPRHPQFHIEGSHAGISHHRAEAPPPPPNGDLQDTASSTHPPPQIRNLPATTAVLHPPAADALPHNTMRDELRRLIQEEFPMRSGSHPVPHRNFQDSSPLADVLLQHPIPAGFKLPTIEPYDGSSDPYEHVDHYRTIMHIQRASDALLCQVFPATLKGQARTWFYSLPNGTIYTFAELAELFALQFIANRRIIKDSSHLSGIRQNEGESLRDYFQRFSSEARQIPGVDPELLRGVFLGGLRPGAFYSSLMRDTV